MIKNYDNENKYKFNIKYFMEYAIGSKYANKIEISKEEYKEMNEKLEEQKTNIIKLFKTYSVGFKNIDGIYVEQEVTKDVFDCLLMSQRKEHHRRKNESRRHLDNYFKQEELDKLPDIKNLENEIVENLSKEELIKIVKSILQEKQSERFIKYVFEDYPMLVIAINDNVSMTAIFNSIERAKKQIKKILKNFD